MKQERSYGTYWDKGYNGHGITELSLGYNFKADPSAFYLSPIPIPNAVPTPSPSSLKHPRPIIQT